MPEQRINTYAKGLLGEADAEEYLCHQGMRCIDRRYHSPYGEIDLIMLDKNDELAFVEVKSRANRTLMEAQLAVTPSKRRKIIQTALCYLSEHPEHQQRLMRFDIVGIAADCIMHLKDAFQGTGW